MLDMSDRETGEIISAIHALPRNKGLVYYKGNYEHAIGHRAYIDGDVRLLRDFTQERFMEGTHTLSSRRNNEENTFEYIIIRIAE